MSSTSAPSHVDEEVARRNFACAKTGEVVVAIFEELRINQVVVDDPAEEVASVRVGVVLVEVSGIVAADVPFRFVVNGDVGHGKIFRRLTEGFYVTTPKLGKRFEQA